MQTPARPALRSMDINTICSPSTASGPVKAPLNFGKKPTQHQRNPEEDEQYWRSNQYLPFQWAHSLLDGERANQENRPLSELSPLKRPYSVFEDESQDSYRARPFSDHASVKRPSSALEDDKQEDHETGSPSHLPPLDEFQVGKQETQKSALTSFENVMLDIVKRTAASTEGSSASRDSCAKPLERWCDGSMAIPALLECTECTAVLSRNSQA